VSIVEEGCALGLRHQPSLLARAPVKAPPSWPKSSFSKRATGTAPQLTGTKGLVPRALCSWIQRA
jgi:hypothetical protein